MPDSPERIYPLVKIDTGDYLLLANDRRTLWRIRRYAAEELLDPTAGTYRTFSAWGLWRWHLTPTPAVVGRVDPDDWGQWVFWEGPFGRRAEAVRDTLRGGETS